MAAGASQRKQVTMHLQSPKAEKGECQQTPRRDTVTSMSAMTTSGEEANLEETRKGSHVSLYGLALTLRAFSVTRRLSLSQYLLSGSTVEEDETPRPEPTNLENTYRLGPKSDEEFKPSEIQRVMQSTLAYHLKDVSYDADDCASLSAHLSNKIKEQVKKLDMPRHKVVCHVVIGQKQRQGFCTASRCLWNAKADNYACAEYSNASLFAMATVYGIYFD